MRTATAGPLLEVMVQLGLLGDQVYLQDQPLLVGTVPAGVLEEAAEWDMLLEEDMEVGISHIRQSALTFHLQLLQGESPTRVLTSPLRNAQIVQTTAVILVTEELSGFNHSRASTAVSTLLFVINISLRHGFCAVASEFNFIIFNLPYVAVYEKLHPVLHAKDFSMRP
jgi:hypothetical protein